MNKEKIIYYSDEINDDFANSNIKAIKVTGDYKYLNSNIFYNFISKILYIIMLPIAYIYSKLKFNFRFDNKKIIKKYREKGFIVYANHTQKIYDVFMPALLSFPKKSYEIVDPDNISIPIQGKLNVMLGAVPLADTISGSKNLLKFMKIILENGNPIFIYPEAHIWPYYTKIRNFSSTSFKYPIKFDVPVFCVTSTYQKRKFRKKPKIISYVDGPFYYNQELNGKERQEDLRNRIYNCMNERSKNSNVNYIKYIKK